MKILFLTVDEPPDQGLHLVSQISSLPGILLDEPVSILRHRPASVHDAEKQIEHTRPDLLVYLGSSGVTAAWKSLLQMAYPRLFMLESASDDWQILLDDVQQRIWVLRHRRVNLANRAELAVQAVVPGELFASLEPELCRAAQSRADRAISQYHLQDLLRQVATPVCERLLYCLDLLEQTLDPVSLPPDRLAVVDVGIKEWSYAPALRHYFRRRAREVELTGLELDPYFYDKNGLTRMDQARHYAELAQARVLEMDFVDYPQLADVVCHFLPVILPENALRWNIPLQYHQPHQLLAQTYTCLKPGGVAILYNGAEIEYQKTIEWLLMLGIAPTSSQPYVCRYRQAEQGFVTLVQKGESHEP